MHIYWVLYISLHVYTYVKPAKITVLSICELYGHIYRGNSSFLLHQRKESRASQAHPSNYRSGTKSKATRKICSAPRENFFIWTDGNSCIFSLPFALSQSNTFLLYQRLFHICALLTEGSIAESQKNQLTIQYLQIVQSQQKEH